MPHVHDPVVTNYIGGDPSYAGGIANKLVWNIGISENKAVLQGLDDEGLENTEDSVAK